MFCPPEAANVREVASYFDLKKSRPVANNQQALIQPEDAADLVVAAVDLPKRAQVTTMTILPTRKSSQQPHGLGE